ncbi:hypothetical protein C8Q75DRAFT_748523 [Abortiporus biennis]|nr:hypothetical protein C8Q75DRAFT_748523 [Abortiporus biennis]
MESISRQPAMPCLSFDVLLIVMDFLDTREDVLSLAKTCRFLYHEGPSRLLGMRMYFYQILGPLLYPREYMVPIDEFASYMALHPSYFKYIKDIGFVLTSSSSPSDDVGSNLTGLLYSVLRRAGNLNTVVLDVPVQSAPDNPFPTHLSFCNLRHLTMGNFSDDTVQFLKTLVAPLETLHITADNQIEVNFILLMANFAATLQELEAYIFAWQVESPPHRIIFPLLSSLLFTLDTPELGPLIEAFPNIKHLSLQLCYILNIENANSDREENIRQEEVLAQSGCRTWSQLEQVDGSILALYGLGLTCKVDILRLEDFKYSMNLVGIFQTLLMDTRPRILQVNLCRDEPSSIHEIVSNDNTETARRTFAYPGLSRLTLGMECLDSPEEVQLTIQTWMPEIYIIHLVVTSDSSCDMPTGRSIIR